MIPLLYMGVVLGQTAQTSLIKLNNRGQTTGVIRFNFFKALAPTLLFLVLLLVKGEEFHLPNGMSLREIYLMISQQGTLQQYGELALIHYSSQSLSVSLKLHE